MRANYNNNTIPTFVPLFRNNDLSALNLPFFPSSIGLSSGRSLLGKRIESPADTRAKIIEKKQRKTLDEFVPIQVPAFKAENPERPALNLQREKPRLLSTDLTNMLSTQAYGLSFSQFHQQQQLQLLSEMNKYQQLLKSLKQGQSSVLIKPESQSVEMEAKAQKDCSINVKILDEEQALTETSGKTVDLEVKTRKNDEVDKETEPESAGMSAEEEDTEPKNYEPVEEPALFVLTKKFPGWNLCTICNFLSSGRAEKDFNIFENVPTRSVRSCRLKSTVEKEEEIVPRTRRERKPKAKSPTQEDAVINTKIEESFEGL